MIYGNALRIGISDFGEMRSSLGAGWMVTGLPKRGVMVRGFCTTATTAAQSETRIIPL
jgi:hypothetical protein